MSTDAVQPALTEDHLKKPLVLIPLLYFMQAMPVFIVQAVAGLVYKDFGIANADIARWTSLISLPWSMQFLLGPLIEFNGTKRMWILGGQAVIAVGLIVTAFSLGTPNAFSLSLAILAITAITSALCNIATDGFYIITQTRDQQTKYAGIQTMCFRLGRLFCTWFMVKFAGRLQTQGSTPEKAWTTMFVIAAVVYLAGFIWNNFALPRVSADVPKPTTEENQNRRNLQRTLLIVFSGLGVYFMLNGLVRLIAHGLWFAWGADPDGKWKGWQLVFPTIDKKVGEITEKVQVPVRWGPLDSPFSPVMSEIVQVAVCGALAFTAIWAARRMLRGSEMSTAIQTFLQLPGITSILFFILFYRLPEAMIGSLSALFYRDSFEKGGLGLSTELVGDVKGLVSVLGIIAGGVLGGWVVHKLGLKRAFLPVALAMHLPNALYLWAAANNTTIPPLPVLDVLNDPSSLVKVFVHPLGLIEFFDQLGYGVGYAAYFVYLMQVAQRGKYVTAHYAIASGLGALCIAFAGISGGIIQSNYGWTGFFWAVLAASIPGLAALYLIPWDDKKPDYAIPTTD